MDLEHDREATVVYVVHRGIPKCCECNTLAAKRPDLIPEWHPTKNGDKKPEDVSYGDDKPVWWQCLFDPSHEWQASPNSRTSLDSGCPHCNKRASKLEIRVYTELLTLFPDALWGEPIHGKECDVLLHSINVGIEVDGGYYHGDKLDTDRAKNEHFKSCGVDTLRLREHPLPKIADIDIQHKKNDRNLALMKVIVQRLRKMRPQIDENTAVRDYLKRKKLAAVEHYRKELAGLQSPPFEKSLEYLHPAIAATWDAELNGKFTPRMFTPGSTQEVYWHCPVEGHPSFCYSIMKRRIQNGCQICTGREVTYETSVAVMLDKIKPIWHPTKNLPTTPDQVRHKEATTKVWWLCPDCGHDWSALPINVIHVATGCEPCSDKRGAQIRKRNKIAKHGSLADLRPDVVAFIDTGRSSEFDPADSTVGSHDEVYIRCPTCAFEWPNKRSIKDLSHKGAVCKKCLTRLEGSQKSKNPLLPVTDVFPEILQVWDTERDNDLLLNRYSRGNSQKIHVHCPNCDYQWPNPREIKQVVKYGLKCPKCKHRFAPYSMDL